MILTEGDYFADFIDRENVGKTVSPNDTEGWKQAILSLAANPAERQAMKARLSSLRERFHWEKVAEPLAGYCRDPYHTRRLSRLEIGISRLLTPAYRRLLHLQKRRPPLAVSSQEDSTKAKFMDNGYRHGESEAGER
jgi:glycosyltransferase involved in cell wall biosynthesis